MIKISSALTEPIERAHDGLKTLLAEHVGRAGVDEALQVTSLTIDSSEYACEVLVTQAVVFQSQEFDSAFLNRGIGSTFLLELLKDALYVTCKRLAQAIVETVTGQVETAIHYLAEYWNTYAAVFLLSLEEAILN